MFRSWTGKGAALYIMAITILVLLNLFQTAAADPTTSGECSDANPAACADTKFSVSTYLRADNQGTNVDSFKKNVESGIGGTIIKLINQLSYVIGTFAMLALIIAGFTYVTSAGQERLITKAKDMVKFAIMGLIIALMAYYITAYVQSLFYEVGK